MKPTQEQVIAWAREAGMEVGAGLLMKDVYGQSPSIEHIQAAIALAYAAGRKDENEACASLEVHLITPTRDYTIMSPLDCYEAALMDEAMAFRAAIRARREQ